MRLMTGFGPAAVLVLLLLFLLLLLLLSSVFISLAFFYKFTKTKPSTVCVPKISTSPETRFALFCNELLALANLDF